MKQLLLVVLVLTGVSCSSVDNPRSTSSWHGSMQGLAQSLTEVMPNLVTTRWANEESQKKKLQQIISQLSDYGENLNLGEIDIPSNDPSIKFLAQDFNLAIKKLKVSARQQSATQLRPDIQNLAQYCVACHTRTPAGSSYFTSQIKHNLENFTSFEKATYLTSLRQYEMAMVDYENALTDKQWATANPQQWEEATMNLLAISVRVKNNPNLTLEFISRLFDTNVVPQKLVKVARQWQRDARAWNKEPAEELTLEKIQKLLVGANQRDKVLTHSGLLLNVRASAALNRYLQAGGLKAYREQGFLYYSGVVGERLERLRLFSFPDTYFKACMEVDPKGPYFARCQKRLSQKHVAGI